MKLRVGATACILSTCILGASCDREPRDYDACILKYVKPGIDKDAAQLLYESCENKFPRALNAGSDQHELSAEEVGKLTGRGAPRAETSDWFAGTLYNGNAQIIVTEVGIGLETTTSGKSDKRLYRTAVSLAPKSAGDFGFTFLRGDPGTPVHWGIVKAWGKKKAPDNN
jgi:hypothetical protein